MGKRMLKIYGGIFFIFLLVLILLIVIPFSFWKCAIPYVWGEKNLRDVISSSVIDLLIGLIASAALAYLTALVTYQNEIKQKEQAFLSDICYIETLCDQAVTPETIGQIVFSLTVYQQRQRSFIQAKTYKRVFFRKQSVKTCIEKTIVKIGELIEDMQERCVGILNTDRYIRLLQDEYYFSLSQTLCPEEIDDYKEKAKDQRNLFSQIEKLRKRNTEETNELSEKTAQMSRDCKEIKELLM